MAQFNDPGPVLTNQSACGRKFQNMGRAALYGGDGIICTRTRQDEMFLLKWTRFSNMSKTTNEWRRTIGRSGNSAYVTIPYPLAVKMGLQNGMVLQIRKHEGWIAMRVDPSQEPVTEETAAEESQPAPKWSNAEEKPISQKEEPPNNDNHICGFDGLEPVMVLMCSRHKPHMARNHCSMTYAPSCRPRPASCMACRTCHTCHCG